MNPFKAERDLSFNALESGVLPQIRPCLRPLSSPFYFLIFSHIFSIKKTLTSYTAKHPKPPMAPIQMGWLRWLRWLWSKLHDLSLSEILCVSNLVKPLWRLCSLLRSILMYTQYSDTHVKRFPNATNATNAEHPARTSFRCSALQQAEWRRCAVQFDASKGRFFGTWIRSRRSQKRRQLHKATKPASWVHNICSHMFTFSEICAPENLLWWNTKWLQAIWVGAAATEKGLRWNLLVYPMIKLQVAFSPVYITVVQNHLESSKNTKAKMIIYHGTIMYYLLKILHRRCRFEWCWIWNRSNI